MAYTMNLNGANVSFDKFQDMIRFVANCEKTGMNLDSQLKSIDFGAGLIEGGIMGVAEYALGLADKMDEFDEMVAEMADELADEEDFGEESEEEEEIVHTHDCGQCDEDFCCYDNGYDDGVEEGYDTGFEAGREEGYDDGHEDGYDEGYKGYNDGHEDGYDEGYTDGYEDGYNSAYEEIIRNAR